jgi:NADH-quinone oxidoreductase subunit M
MPNFAVLAMIFTMASVGLPGTSGFVGEFLTILGAFKANWLLSCLAAMGVVLGACYMLWLYKRVWFSEITNKNISGISDLNLVELTSLILLAGLVILFGFAPNLIFELFSANTSNLADQMTELLGTVS